jgi:hypothetical protein
MLYPPELRARILDVTPRAPDQACPCACSSEAGQSADSFERRLLSRAGAHPGLAFGLRSQHFGAELLEGSRLTRFVKKNLSDLV